MAQVYRPDGSLFLVCPRQDLSIVCPTARLEEYRPTAWVLTWRWVCP